MNLTPPPYLTAMFDQGWASVNEKVDILLEAYEHILEDHDELPRELAIMFFSSSIEGITSHVSCAELVACAIDRLVRQRVGS